MKLINLIIVLSIFLCCFSACNEPIDTGLTILTTTVEFENSHMSFLEKNDTVNVLLIFSNILNEKVTIGVSVIDSTAVEGEHFILPSKQIEATVGMNSIQIPIIINNDSSVNINRSFRLEISETEGVERALISQNIEIVIINDDLWPEIQFTKPQFTILERENGIYIPYEVKGDFSEDMVVDLEFKDITATKGVHYEVPDITSFTISENKKDSIWVKINPTKKELLKDVVFSMKWTIRNAGTIAKNEKAFIKISDVKVAKFKEQNSLIIEPDGPKGVKIIEVPIEFNYVPKVGVTVIVDLITDLGTDKYKWENELKTSKDTILYAVLTVDTGVVMPQTIKFQLQESELCDVYAGTLTARKGVSIDRSAWEVFSCSSFNPKPWGNAGGRPEYMIDEGGKDDSRWVTMIPPTDGKCETVFDMVKQCKVTSIDMRRHGFNMEIATVEVSTDNVNWSKPYTFDFLEEHGGKENQHGTLRVYSQKVLVARYLRVTGLQTRRLPSWKYSMVEIRDLQVIGQSIDD